MNIIINLNKPRGITSQQAVTRVKKLFGVRKAGHTGTLDPMATGVLLVCLNEATKASRFLLDKDKVYSARMKLGQRTDTCDADGKIIETRSVPLLSRDDISAVSNRFIGTILQRPPMYSAVKINGRPLYELARKGIEVDRAERQIKIYDIRITEVALPYIDLTISCSKGTYIRTLCDDIGLMLGTGAHLTALDRLRIGNFSIDGAATFDTLQYGALPEGPHVLSIDAALSELPEIFLSEPDCRKARNGVALDREIGLDMPSGTFMRMKTPAGELFGIGLMNQTKIAIERILNL
jgi:tRNA pseudouridine55 synthase